LIIQIYAFTDPDTACTAAALGVNHIGFIAGQYGIVNGELSFKQAREIVKSLPPGTASVALTMSDDINEILRMASEVTPDIIHVSTDPEQVGISAMQELRKHLQPNILLMKAIPVEDESSIEIAKQYASMSDFILLDSKHREYPGVGATGITHDWNISKQIVESISVPVILAGGLNAENVGIAIKKIRPAGVDSNTFTNRENSKVRKDLGKINKFIQAVVSSDHRLQGI